MPGPKHKYHECLQKARKHLTKNEYKNARLMYFQAYNLIEDNKERSIIWAELSWVYYYEADYAKAIEAAENVHLYDPDYKAMEDLNRLMGFSYSMLKEYALAEKHLSESLGQDSASDKQQFVKFELGKIHFIRGNYDLAYPYLKDIIDFFKNRNREYYLTLLFYLGFINYYLENQAQARQYFEEILQFKPAKTRKASAFFGLSFIEFKEKNYLNVISLCEKIMTLDEQFFDRESLGFLTAASYFYLGRKDIFAEYYDQMIKSYPQGRYRQELENLAKSDVSGPGSGRKSKD